MKNNLFFQLISLSLVLMIFSDCNRTGKKPKGNISEGKDNSLVTGIPDTVQMKVQIMELIRKIPDGVVIADLLNEAGASYIYELTVPQEAVDKMLTSTQKAFGAGMIAFDTKYAATFKRGDHVITTRTNLNKLNTELGLAEELNLARKFAGRIERNRSNIDSLVILTDPMVDNYRQYILNGDHAFIYSRQFIGVNIEALYVLSHLTLLANHKEKLLAVMNNQNERIKVVENVLEVISRDENVRPYYENIAPVFKYLGERENISGSDLEIIIPMIDKARNAILP
jgi:hypothetical protein